MEKYIFFLVKYKFLLPKQFKHTDHKLIQVTNLSTQTREKPNKTISTNLHGSHVHMVFQVFPIMFPHTDNSLYLPNEINWRLFETKDLLVLSMP